MKSKGRCEWNHQFSADTLQRCEWNHHFSAETLQRCEWNHQFSAGTHSVANGINKLVANSNLFVTKTVEKP